MFDINKFVAPWINEVVDFKVSAWSLLCLFVGYLLTRLGRARAGRKLTTRGFAYSFRPGWEMPTAVVKAFSVYLLAEKPVASPVFKPLKEQEEDRLCGVGAVRLAATGKLLRGSFLIGRTFYLEAVLMLGLLMFMVVMLSIPLVANEIDGRMFTVGMGVYFTVTFLGAVPLRHYIPHWQYRHGSLILAEQPLSEYQIREILKNGFSDPQLVGKPRKSRLLSANSSECY